MKYCKIKNCHRTVASDDRCKFHQVGAAAYRSGLPDYRRKENKHMTDAAFGRKWLAKLKAS